MRRIRLAIVARSGSARDPNSGLLPSKSTTKRRSMHFDPVGAQFWLHHAAAAWATSSHGTYLGKQARAARRFTKAWKWERGREIDYACNSSLEVRTPRTRPLDRGVCEASLALVHAELVSDPP